MGLIAEHGRGSGQHVLGNQVFPDDGNDHTGGADVLLHAAVEHSVFGHVHRLGQEAGGNVGDQRLALGVGQLPELGAVNGVVFTDVDIVRVLVDGQVGAVGDIGEGLVGGGGHRVGGAVHFGLLPCLFRPLAGDDVIGNPVFHQVHRHHGELLACAALHEQDLVIVGDSHEGAQISLRPIDDGLIGLGAVAHFHDGHAGSPVIQHFSGGFLQNALRQDCGACGKIIDSGHCFFLP